MDVNPGTIVVWGDVACPWATLAVHRLHEARARLGLEARVAFDHRAFPLELLNEQPTPRPVIDAEIPVVGSLAPSFCWQVWQGDGWAYPGSVLLALEAVQAAKEQSVRASEQLDLALRRAFFAHSEPIGMRHAVLAAARACADVDEDKLAAALDEGRARPILAEQARQAASGEVQGSPHLFLPDGTDAVNPGVDFRWEGPKPAGIPVVESDDPEVYDDLLRRAAR